MSDNIYLELELFLDPPVTEPAALTVELNRKIIGIDLGTTYSCVAYINEFGQTEILPNAEGERTTPSVVWFDGKRAAVGVEAKEMAPVEFNSVCSFVKRNMGNDDFFFEAGGIQYQAEHVSSLILRKLVKDASKFLGEQITDVVITCPAYFFIKERDCVKRAGEMAGLNVLQIVNEPTAAAVAYGVRPGENNTKETTVMVYDLGGGTFDVTLIHVTPNGLDVICTDGDHQLGGKDWDDRLVQFFARRYSEETGLEVDLSNTAELYQDLLQQAEQTKKQLTAKTVASVKFSHEGETVKTNISRNEFEELTSDLLEKTVTLTHSLLEAAGEKGFIKFDTLVLVGGSSRMPQVEKRLKEEFGVTPVMFDPDEAVAKGAAIIGNNIHLRRLVEEKLKQKTKTELTLDDASPEQLNEAMQETALETGYTLEVIQRAKRSIRNVTSKSFGIVTISDTDEYGNESSAVSNLIYRNTNIPVTKSNIFTTWIDYQENVLVELMENMADRKVKKDNGEEFDVPIRLDESTKLWEGELKLMPGLMADSPIQITFQIDESGLLTLIAEDPASGNKLVQKIQTGYSAVSESIQTAQRCRELVVE